MHVVNNVHRDEIGTDVYDGTKTAGQENTTTENVKQTETVKDGKCNDAVSTILHFPPVLQYAFLSCTLYTSQSLSFQYTCA